MNKKFILLPLILLNIAAAADPGKKLYVTACQTCHSPAVAQSLGAPAAFDKKAWQARLREAKRAMANQSPAYKNVYQYLLAQVKIGKGLMHHGGLCKENPKLQPLCTDENYIKAIKYMMGSPD